MAPSDPSSSAPTLTGDTPESGAVHTGLSERKVARERVRAELFGQPPAATKIGRFTVIELLGSGGMGEVFAVYDPTLDRKVAIKVINEAAAGSARRHRQLRAEAQAMAKLNHPNVATVHEVGTHGEQVYIAMEFVAGVSLRQWLAKQSRDWREVVAVYAQAGEGLAAAHDAGLVHRDFKPDNVLVGDDGRVRVVDFGLAREAPDPAVLSTQANDAVSSLDAEQEVTHRTRLAGTPRYMAPEQYAGDAADARTDQFAFCVALYEALHGQHPFVGETTHAVAAAIIGNERRPMPSGSRVPGRIQRVVERGLSLAPADRFASMRALVAALAPRARSRRLAALLFAGGGITAFAASAMLWERAETKCSGAQSAIAEAWNEQHADRIVASWRASGQPYVDEAWPKVRTRLDAYADAWSEAHRDACEATHVRGEQSEALLDRRMICLQRRRADLGALVEALVSEDPGAIRRAPEAVSGLSTLEPCADVEALQADVAQAEDAATRASANEIRDLLSKVRALEAIGRLGEALSLAEEADAKATELAFDPLRAETSIVLGRMRWRNGDFEGATEDVEQGVWLGTATGHAPAVAEGATLRVVLGLEDKDFEHAELWARHAEAAVARAGRDPQQSFLLETQAGRLAMQVGRYEESQRRLSHALSLAREHKGEQSLLVAKANANLGLLAFMRERYAEAIELTEEAVATLEGQLGTRHPDVAAMRQNLAEYRIRAGQTERALEELRSVLDVWTETLAPDHPDLALVNGGIASALRALGRADEALPYQQRELDIRTKTYGTRHPAVAHGLINLGSQHEAMGDLPAAQQQYEQAWSILAEVTPLQPLHLYALINLASVLRRQGRLRQAVPHLEQALEIAEELFEGPHMLKAAALHELGIIAQEQGQAQQAIERLQQCVEMLGAGEASPDIAADAHFRLGEMLWSRGQQRAAVEHVRAARDGFETQSASDQVAAADDWLKTHP